MVIWCILLKGGMLKSLEIPIADRSHYQGFPITEHKTQDVTQLIHLFRPSALLFKQNSANKNLSSCSHNSNFEQTYSIATQIYVHSSH